MNNGARFSVFHFRKIQPGFLKSYSFIHIHRRSITIAEIRNKVEHNDTKLPLSTFQHKKISFYINFRFSSFALVSNGKNTTFRRECKIGRILN